MDSNAVGTVARKKPGSAVALGIIAGVALSSLVVPEHAHAFQSAKEAIREICSHMTGSLGGLLMTVAGIGGLTAAAFGNFRASHSFIVTAVGAFAIGSILSIYFEGAAGECLGAGGGEGGGARINTPAAQGARTFGGNADFGDAAVLPHGEEEPEDVFQQFDPSAGETFNTF